VNKENNQSVSICIPAYKSPSLLNRCLNSIVNQTYKHIEIIITDDSPNDEVFDVVKKFAGDTRIKYLKNHSALGTPENWNEGLRLASGEYIKIMHHDDWFTSDRSLEVFMNKAFESGADFVCSYCNNVFPSGIRKHKIAEIFKKKWAKDKSLVLFANYLGNPSITLFRNKKEPVLYDNRSLWYVDVLFYYEFTASYPNVAYVDDFIVNISGGLDTQVTNSVITASVRLKEFFYVSQKHNLFNTHGFLSKITILEIMKRCNVTSKSHLEDILGQALPVRIPYWILKLPIHHQVYNILKYLLILYR
jgi:glycosyltransferase involved in cell wall biosynthesis